MTYAAKCASAARRQGLQPAIDGLRRLFEGVTVEQTGGWSMVVQVPCPVGHVWVTRDGPEPDEWVVGYYPDPDDESQSTEQYTYCNLGVLPEVIAHHYAGRSSTQERR